MRKNNSISKPNDVKCSHCSDGYGDGKGDNGDNSQLTGSDTERINVQHYILY